MIHDWNDEDAIQPGVTRPTPLDIRGETLVDSDGPVWTITRNELRTDGDARRRIPGRHGLWFAFRTHFEDAHVLR